MRATLSVTLTLLAAGSSFVQAQTINLKAGKAQSSAPVQNRIATELPPAPDLATAYFYVEKLPLMLPGGGTFLASTYALNNADHIFGVGGGTVPIIWNGSSVVFSGPSNYRISSVSVGKLNDFSDLVVNRVTGGPEGAVFSFAESAGFTLQRTLAGRVVHLINDAGWLVATEPDDRWDNEEGYWGRHYILRGSAETPIKLPHDATRGAVFSDQNLFGEIVGSADPNFGNTGARAIYVAPDGQFRWLPGDAIFDQAHAINVHGQIVGQTAVPDGPFYASSDLPAFWENGRGGKIETLPTGSIGYEYAYANGINRWGQIVGHTSQGAGLWINKKQVDLTGRLINPDNLTVANLKDINDDGVMLGETNFPNYASFRLRPVWPKLAVDANRDGVIQTSVNDVSDTTSTAAPYHFWANDDDDDGDDKRAAADDIPLPEGDSKRDSENTKVDGIRDLEDFFPVFFDIKQLLSMLPPGTNDLAYYLKHEDSALGVVFTSYTRAQAFDYLRGSPTALDTGFGPALTQKAGDATVVKITAAGVNISTAGQPTASPAFFDRIRNNDGGVLLVEASKATIKPLVLEVRKSGIVIAEISLPLKVDPVETMFRYVNLRSFAHGTPIAANNQGPGYGSTTPTAAPNDPFTTASNRKNMVFVHGYNVNGEGARGAAATAFKRFYWSGSKAKFYAVLWRGDDGQGAGIAPAGATPDYHRNVGHAWQQGPLFRDFLGTLQGDTAIMAHSLGNGVTKVALTRARDPNNPARLIPASKPATVKHYFAVDSALPLEATSASDITTESKSRMRHSWWAEYDSQERLWPTHWHKLFEGTGDGREGLTWQNVFANLEVGTNFYSSGEEVLANPVNDSMPVWEPLFFAGLRAWIAQEKHKGGNGVAASFFRSWTAGWVENEAWYVPIVPTPPYGSPQTRRRFASEAQDVAAPNGVPTSALASEPFFQRFQASESGGFYPGYQGSRLHAPIGDTNADDEARKLVTVAKCLGEAIPALSYPQGSNPASAFTGPGMGGNFNLNDDYDPNTGLGFKNSWPTSRPRNDWLHSDCLDVSYIFHFRFYDRMKINGGL
ncbi:MAG: hypothetical protein NDI75_03825 [Candidatus Didemnitutus sp.]|nr:hypothetical protein [Candidatus Didemnitutus sp.]